jgi:hypothetical protein
VAKYLVITCVWRLTAFTELIAAHRGAVLGGSSRIGRRFAEPDLWPSVGDRRGAGLHAISVGELMHRPRSRSSPSSRP